MEGLTDDRMLTNLARIREILDGFRKMDPRTVEGGTKGYLASYRDLQDSYAAVLTAARRRGLTLPPWEGDHAFFSPLVDKWVMIHDLL